MVGIRGHDGTVKRSTEVRDVPKTALQAEMTGSGSALEKYRNLAVGRPGWWNLLKYELILTGLGTLPGALGLALRRLVLPLLFGACGRGVVFGKNLTIRHPHKIRIGDRCVIDDYCVLDAKGDDNAGIQLGDDVVLARNVVLACKGGDIEIGTGSNISHQSILTSENRITLRQGVLIAARAYIVSGGTHDFDRVDIPIIQQGSTAAPVTIEDYVWMGANVTVLDGVTVGHDAVCGAGSLIYKDVPAWAVMLGNPARVVKRRQPLASPSTEGQED